MDIYEINEALYNLIDENGEIADYEQFIALNMQRDEKISNMACWYVNLVADADKIKKQEAVLSERRKVLENRAKSIKSYIDRILDGNKFSDDKVTCSYRKSTATELAEDFIKKADAKYLKIQDPVPDKKLIADDLKAGIEIDGASLVEHNNLNIK